ncbi:hypothetical protein LTR36_008754 [Oleoguttula mirabilis]|uniref:Uncharacterized protein n=1 Tax=Oleoguttula mirabilis TaxID=1507867 RepID=A0AAV9JU62_9PEZI|nr:hypothetical protein LTR36_008754 [Oleoguttula mirabilis]
MADAHPLALLQKLSAELRMQIYRDVLRTEGSLLPCQPNGKQCLIDISLPLVNKAIHNEAVDALFEANAIRLRHFEAVTFFPNPVRGRTDVLRHIDLVDLGRVDIWRDESYLRRTLELAISLPKLMTVTIGYDGLVQTGCTLDHWVQASGFSRQELRCMVEFELACGQVKVKRIFSKHYALVRKWHTVKADAA